MFDIEKEVPSLELCRKLKELGYPQTGGGLYWKKWKDKENWDVGFVEEEGRQLFLTTVDFIKAPTLGEMGEVLSAKIDALGDESNWFLRIEKWGDCWYVDLSKFAYCICSERGKRLPNTYAKMLIWLAKNGYLSFERKEANNA